MNKMLLLAGAAVVLFSAQANAFDVKPYVSAKVKYVDMSADYSIDGETVNTDDYVYGGSVALGLKTLVKGGAVRAEFEFNKNDEAKRNYSDWGMSVKSKVHSFMVNGYYDICTGTKFTPYVGAGLGYATMHGTMYDTDWGNEAMLRVSRSDLAWQAGLGASYALTDHVAVDAGYRYVDYGKRKSPTMYDYVRMNGYSNEFYVGARYTF